MEITTNKAIEILGETLQKQIARAREFVADNKENLASLRKNANPQKVKDCEQALEYSRKTLLMAQEKLAQFEKFKPFISQLDEIENIISDYVGKRNSIYKSIGDKADFLVMDLAAAKRDGFLNVQI